MIAGLVIVFVSFLALMVASLRSARSRARIFRRSLRDWTVDFSGLVVQGLAIPLLQALALAPLWFYAFPELRGALGLPWWLSFSISLIAIDYVYYWNHRMLHAPIFWRWHRLHHSAEETDIFATARNSLLTPVFIVYLWINSIFIFALGDPAPFIVASSVGAALDLWRHSGFSIPVGSRVYRWLSGWVILPQQHARHHAIAVQPANFGANFSWWDRAHGTFHLSSDEETSPAADAQIPPATSTSTISWRDLVWPRREESS